MRDMRGSGAKGNPNRAYRRYTAIPLIDYIVCKLSDWASCVSKIDDLHAFLERDRQRRYYVALY